MPSMIMWPKIFCVAVVFSVLFACGKANDSAPALDSTGKHPAAWLAGHRSAYQQNRDQCRECHGIDLKGGITKVDCFNQAALGRCHAGGHGPRSVPHPLPFTAGAVHGPFAKKDFVYCQSCHGTAGGPGSNPRFTVLIGALKKGCEDCHKPFTAHPPLPGSTSGWAGHPGAGNMGNSCTLCHGVDLAGGAVAPGCNSCHTKLSPGTVPTVGTCVSCHASPPVSRGHSVHNAVTEIKNVCATCHDGAGSGSTKHKNGAVEVAFAVSYNAKSGSALKNSNGSCSNISCHGGVVTPVWGGILTQGCLSCHTPGTVQYNGYYSGEHTLHITVKGLQCTDCHDMSRTSGTISHYSGLGTSGIPKLPASVTIRVPGYTSTNPSCTPGTFPVAGTYSVGVCHGNKTW